MNTNITGFRCFSEIFVHPCSLDESSLSIGRVNPLVVAVHSSSHKFEHNLSSADILS